MCRGIESKEWNAITSAICEGDWHKVADAVDRAIQTYNLDVWYDHPPLNEAVMRHSYSCYTCFMKGMGVFSEDTECYVGYTQREDLIRRHCGLRDYSKYMGGYFAPLEIDVGNGVKI